MQVFKTDRLVVRRLEDADLPDFYAVCSDPVAMRYMGDGEPLTEEQTALWIQRSKANYSDHAFGCLAVISKQDSRFIGFCGLVYSPGSTDVEIIYALAPPYWGKGLTTEVAGAMLKFGLEQCGLPEIRATIDPQNTNSVKVVEKLGMTFVGERIDEDDVPVLVYSIKRSA
jgi:[ribosomal protein S5]-alanine N-acetyltransferase